MQERAWVCTRCSERTAVGQPMVLLDGTYGSARCSSRVCKRAKRVFHLEVIDADRPTPRHHQDEHR